ncbi:MAG: GDSL-type esterase/lipase family protein [Gammaproteobacteria bacterium]
MNGRRRLPFALLLLAALLFACSGGPHLPRLVASDVVLAFGDSLTYGVGAHRNQAYPAVLQTLLGRPVINAGVPGETTAEGLKRLPQTLDKHQPKILLLCLGGNDLLRGRPRTEITQNLRTMVALSRERNVAVVLVGVPEPRLFGGTAEFYEQIAEEFGLPYESGIMNEVLRSCLESRRLRV